MKHLTKLEIAQFAAISAVSAMLGLGTVTTTFAAAPAKHTSTAHSSRSADDNTGDDRRDDSSGSQGSHSSSSGSGSSKPAAQPNSGTSSKPSANATASNGQAASGQHNETAAVKPDGGAAMMKPQVDAPVARMSVPVSALAARVPAARFAAPQVPSAGDHTTPVYNQGVLGVSTGSETTAAPVASALHADLAAFTILHNSFVADNAIRIILLVGWGIVNAVLLSQIRRRRSRVNSQFKPINLGTWRYAK